MKRTINLLLALVFSTTAFAAVTNTDKAELGVEKNSIANGGAERGTAGFSKYFDGQTATVTIASPGVFTTSSAHGLAVNDPVSFTTTGALPTGLTAGTKYYVSSVPSSTTFQVASSIGGSSINTTGSQSGTHTFRNYRPLRLSGGTASHLTLSTTTSSPLEGSRSLTIANSGASSALGEGVVYPFTIDAKDKNGVMSISFRHSLSSGTFQAGSMVSSTITDSDLEIYIWDATNGVLIQPSQYILDCGAVVDVQCTFRATFQATSSTSYKLGFHVATTNTSAWTQKIDSIKVNPAGKGADGRVIAFAVNAATPSGTPTSSGTISFGAATVDTANAWNGTTTYTFPVGGWYELATDTIINGTASTNVTYSIQIAATGGAVCNASDGGSPSQAKFRAACRGLYLAKAGETASVTFVQSNLGSAAWQGASNSFTITRLAGPTSGDEGRAVALGANGQPSGTIPTSSTPSTVIFPGSNLVDTHGAYNATTGVYTVPVAGVYSIQALVVINGTSITGGQLQITKNSTVQSIIAPAQASASRISMNVTGNVQANAGDTLKIEILNMSGSGHSYLGGVGSLAIQRVSGPLSSGFASETVAAEYNSTAGGSVTNNAMTFIDFGTKETDTHSAVSGVGSGNTTTSGAGWRFICPYPGRYHVTATAGFAASSVSNMGGAGTYIAIYRDGSQYKQGDRFDGQSTGSAGFLQFNVDGVVRCQQGSRIEIGLIQNAGGTTRTLSNSAANVHVEIVRVGNY